MHQSTPSDTRHPELVSGSIGRFNRTKRWQAQPNGKIAPLWIALVDQVDFPLPVPPLQLLLAQDCRFHFTKQFIVNQPVDFMARSKTGQSIVPVLPHSPKQIGRNPNVKRAVMPAGQNINARKTLLPHRTECGAKWTLKQVQGDEVGLGLEAIPKPPPIPKHPKPRHAELVSASIVPDDRRAGW